MSAPFFFHWYVGEDPADVTLNVAVAPVITDASTGWAVIDGDDVVDAGADAGAGGGALAVDLSVSDESPPLQPAHRAWTSARAAAF